MKLVLALGGPYCGQSCIAMVAGVSLEDAIEAVNDVRGYRVGKRGGGTSPRDLIDALRSFDVQCADRFRPVSKLRPVLPKRAIVYIGKYPKEKANKYPIDAHWMLTWDGVIYDPGGYWPGGFEGWKMTSYLEIFS